jgi:hypothetical protein
MRLVERANLPTTHPDQPGLFERIMATMQMDKKFRDGKNLFVLPTKPGAWQQGTDVPWPLVHEAVALRSRAAFVISWPFLPSRMGATQSARLIEDIERRLFRY